MALNFLLCRYDNCSPYSKLITVMYSLFLASVIMFFQTIVNLFLLKGYYKFHSYRVPNVLVSFLYLIIWYDFATWSVSLLILSSGDNETNPGLNLWTNFFNLPLEFKQYFSPQFYQNVCPDFLRFSP